MGTALDLMMSNTVAKLYKETLMFLVVVPTREYKNKKLLSRNPQPRGWKRTKKSLTKAATNKWDGCIA
eukprot:scaffold25076_cov122-Cylindrotheca_fusiformis.AAC.2